jgi:ATP-binding cassette subfamily B (MDR/TAP) protein 1
MPRADDNASIASAEKPRKSLFRRGNKASQSELVSVKLGSKASHPELPVLPVKLDEKNGSEDSVVEAPKEPELVPVSFTSLFRFATPREVLINFLGLAAAVAAGAAQPVMTIIFGRLTQGFVDFSTVLAIGTQEEIAQAAASFRHDSALNASYVVYIGVGMFFCTVVYMNCWIYTGEVNAKRVRETYLQSILRQDIAFFDTVGAGEVATRIQNDTHLVQEAISEKVAIVFFTIAAFFSSIIIAYIKNWKLALALTSVLPCMIITGGVMNKAVAKYMQFSLKEVAEGGNLAEEVFSTIRTAQAFGSQGILSNMYDVYIRAALTSDTKQATWFGGGYAIIYFVIYCAYALVFNFGTTLINRGEANAGTVITVALAIMFGAFTMSTMTPHLQAISTGRGAAAKLFYTIDRVPSIDSANPGGVKPQNVKGDITLHNVDFSYPARPNVPIVKNLSLHFPAGRTAALVGASGSGKSTIISLVERFYDPIRGSVTIDGVDIKDWNVKYLRSTIGLVSQEPVLFATTIWQNVAHGLINTPYEGATQEVKDQLIRNACVQSNADGFISKLPLGYQTMVGERGFLLSGGQKQRVAIARAIVSDPRILLLDEATSALDTQSEEIVQDALDKASAGRTTITIAHRLSTIKDAECIYVMGDGLVLEQGTHNQLLSNPEGAYAKLVAAQKLREAKDQAASGTNNDSGSHGQDHKEIGAGYSVPSEDRDPGRRQSFAASVASEVIKTKKLVTGSEDEGDYSLTYVFKRIGGLYKEGLFNYGLGGICAIITGMVYPAYGVVFGKGIEGFSQLDNATRRHEGDRNALWLFILAIVSSVGFAFQNYFFASSASTLTAKLRSLSFRAILRQDIAYFDEDKHSSGSLTSAVSGNPQKVNGLAGNSLGAIVHSISCLISGCILGLVFIWKAALVAIATVPFLVSTGFIRLRVVVLKDQFNKKSHEDSAQLACEAAGAIKTVAALTREEDCCRLYSESLEEPLKKSTRTAIWSSMLHAFGQSVLFFSIALVFWYGARLVSFQEFTTFQFFVGLMSTTYGATQAGQVFAFVPDISSAKGAASDIIKLLDSRPEIDAESPEGKKVNEKLVRGQIHLRDVHFRYPTRPSVRVLRGLNLTIEPGTYVALVGASGCGKSTVIQLIERFYNPLAGGVFLDGEDISEFNIQEYRKQISLVSQEPTLYAGTVLFNILLGASRPHEDITQEEIEEACRSANILEFIQGLPDGFNTQVGGKGSQLSGGQKQRIAIARALLRNPKVLLLDEATSALDSNSEKIVQQALDTAARGRTTIAIAHRLSTIQNADRIYFLKEGVVSEYGTHDELLAMKGDYYEYVQLQALSKNEEH